MCREKGYTLAQELWVAMIGNHIPQKQGQSFIPGVCTEEGALKRSMS